MNLCSYFSVDVFFGNKDFRRFRKMFSTSRSNFQVFSNIMFLYRCILFSEQVHWNMGKSMGFHSLRQDPYAPYNMLDRRPSQVRNVGEVHP